MPNVLWYMKKNDYAETTIEATGKRLRSLQRHCNLEDPEDVKGYIANKQCSNAFKETPIETYNLLMRSIDQKWRKPFYARYDKQPENPTEEITNMLMRAHKICPLEKTHKQRKTACILSQFWFCGKVIAEP